MASVPDSAGALIVRPLPLVRAPAAGDAGAITVGQLCEAFMDYRRAQVARNELTPYVAERYEITCQRLKNFFGSDMPVNGLRAFDFTRFRNTFPETWGLAKVGQEIVQVRVVFNFGYNSELIDRRPRFGPDFKRPRRLLYRRLRRENGLRMFEAEEIRTLLDAIPYRQSSWHPWTMRAMILLGINCAFGPADCGRLTFEAVDLKGNVVDFPRQKTETDRRCPLWPETREAIERALLERPKPTSPEFEGFLFITKYGNQWCNGNPSSAITQRFKRLLQRAGLRIVFRNFYGLRRSFRTIADETSDHPAIDLIMGHTPPSGDMASVYRQRIGDDRLWKVVNHVRSWLFPGDPLDWDDPNHQKAAQRIVAKWDAMPRLSGSDVAEALSSFGYCSARTGTWHRHERAVAISSHPW